MVDRHQERERRKFIRAGTIAAATYNVNRDAKKYPQGFSAEDIFPSTEPADSENQESNGAGIDLFFTGVVTEYRQQHPEAANGKPKGRTKVSRSEMVEA